MTIRIGTSGWNYPEWRGGFYPVGLPHRRELEYLAERLDSVELNGSFYSLQKPANYRSWVARTPDGFLFAVKGGRYITHLKRLRDIRVPLANFFASGVLALGAKLGPVLWQFPGNVSFDPERFAGFLAMLPRTTAEALALAGEHDDKVGGDRVWLEIDEDRPLRHAVEPRHPSFGTPAALALLREHGVALVAADTAGTWPYFEETTADFTYIRLHGHRVLYEGPYREVSLDRWADKIRRAAEAGDVYVYFDNTSTGDAPYDALTLAGLLAEARPAPGR